VHGVCSEGLFGNGSCTCELGWTGTSCSTTGLGLYWKFDETTGTVAADSSGNNLTGNYVSTTAALPTPAPGIIPLPSMAAWDPGSLSFQRNTRQAVQLSSADGGPSLAAVKPTVSLSIAVWYKAGTGDLGTSGSDLVSLGDHYVLRLWRDRLEFDKHVIVGTNNLIIQCMYMPAPDGGVLPFLNGDWHHIVGVTSNVAPGMAIYLDGVLVPCDQLINGANATSALVYTGLGQDFWVGRHGNNSPNFDFQGNIDEVRIYNRALPVQEIQALAQGTHVPP
jgi:hypothetical protein